MIERTLVLVKPDGVKRSLIGEILSRFEKAGMRIVGLNMVWPDEDIAKYHYEEHIEKPFFNRLKDGLISGPVVALVLEGVNAIKKVRIMVGSTEAGFAKPGTIRGDFGLMTYDAADSNNLPLVNLVHASSSSEDAEKEIELWFDEDNLHDYSVAHEDYVSGKFV